MSRRSGRFFFIVFERGSMRRKSTIESLLVTTAMVLIAAVCFAFVYRLINGDGETREEADPSVSFTEPVLAAGESLLEIEGFIDRHQAGGELIFLLDEVQAPVQDMIEPPVSQESLPPTESKSQAATGEKKQTNTSGDGDFVPVDIRYYVLSEEGLNFRQTPSTSSPVIKKLAYGKAIRVIGLGKEWARVRLEGNVTGYVAKSFISQYPPVTTPTSPPPTSGTSKAPATTTGNSTTTPPSSTTKAPSGSPSISPLTFVVKGGQNAMVKANLDLLKGAGLINKEGSPSINRHYASFEDNGDGTITVDGMTFSFIEKYGSRYATHYDGLEVCAHQIRARGGRCRLGHTSPTNHHTGSGVPAQRGIVAVGAQDVSIYPRGTVLFIRGYGMAVVGDRSGGNLDLCYDAGECAQLTRSNTVSAIYVISRP